MRIGQEYTIPEACKNWVLVSVLGVIVRVCFDLGFVISVKFGGVMGGRVIRVSRVRWVRVRNKQTNKQMLRTSTDQWQLLTPIHLRLRAP